MLEEVIYEALQIHGVYGYMSEYESTNLYRDARIDRIFEGTNEINRMTVGRTLINKMRKSKNFSKKILAEANDEKSIPERLAEGSSVDEINILKIAKHLFKRLLKTTWDKYGKQLF